MVLRPEILGSIGQPAAPFSGKGFKHYYPTDSCSGARVKASVAVELMRQSPSIKINKDGTVFALRRVFVLPKFEVPRAAFVVERYLDTLQKNELGRKRQTPLLLERSCYVSEVDLTTIAPMLRAETLTAVAPPSWILSMEK